MRKVRKKDWDFILELRNNRDFRKFFYNQHTITKKEHYNYLQKQQKNPNFVNWIISIGNKNVGYVRILDNDVSIIIDKKHQGRGIGTKVIKLIEIEAKKIGIKKLVAKVMIFNKNSKKIFEKNGFKPLMYWLEKEIN
ncbi:MAG: GNAT family N-acetyltransferase [Candidatus Nitrosotenuis sp.]